MEKKPHHFFGALLCLFISTLTGNAQCRVIGVIVDKDKLPVGQATVLLLHARDSVLVKGAVTEKNGAYIFSNITAGQYMVSSTYAGFLPVYSSVLVIKTDEKLEVDTLTLAYKEVVLAGVRVDAKKPMFEQKIDRMIINVESSITNAGSTALEVLMRSPGINVNQQNNTISMNGKEGVVVMLNGRINRMPITAVVQMLAGMSSSNIEKIELITTPPANFDAEGNAGFINIVLKTNTLYGTNGSFSVTGGYGLHAGPVVSNSINFNHRKGAVNIYGDLSYNRIKLNSRATANRYVKSNGNLLESFMVNDRDDFRRNANARLGIDYEINNRLTLGLLLTGFSNVYGMDALNTTNNFLNSKLDTVMVIFNTERHPQHNYGANINLAHTMKNDQQLILNLDYVHYKIANVVDYFNKFYNAGGALVGSQNTQSNKATPIDFWVAATDYKKGLGKNANLDAGLKATVSTFINDVAVQRELQSGWSKDPAFTSIHHLRESILAAYTSLSLMLGKKTSSKFGLRYEYTNSNLGAETVKNIVDRHYGNLFPNFFLAHALNGNSSINFSYSRRITRPTFNDMAPFVYFIDPNNFLSGNPALQPATANAVKADYLFKQSVFSLSYTHDKNTITNFVPKVNTENNQQTWSAENQKDRHIVAMSISLPVTVRQWWTMQNSITGQWQQLNAYLKMEPLQITQANVNINTTQTFTLPKAYSLELNGAYQSGGLFGIYKMKPVLSLNFSAQKKLGPKHGALAFNITDFYGPPNYRYSINAPEQNLVTDLTIRFAVTTCKLTYTRKFGSDKVKAARSRSTASEAERQRVQAN